SAGDSDGFSSAATILGTFSTQPSSCSSRQPFQIPVKPSPCAVGTTTQSGAPPRCRQASLVFSQISNAMVLYPSMPKGFDPRGGVWNPDTAYQPCCSDIAFIRRQRSCGTSSATTRAP